MANLEVLTEHRAAEVAEVAVEAVAAEVTAYPNESSENPLPTSDLEELEIAAVRMAVQASETSEESD